MTGVATGSRAAPAEASADWRLAIPAARRRHLRVWLWSGATLTLLIMVAGGITRLTQAGLPTVDWGPLLEMIPPVGEPAWRDTHAQYLAAVEGREGRSVGLAEFRSIYLWEYVHQMLARFIGLVFLLPFLYFLARGYLRRPLLGRTLSLFALGGLQGFLAWFMVRSGLLAVPGVSDLRLGIYLPVAFAIFAGCLWFALDLAPLASRPRIPEATRRWIRGALLGVGALFCAQVFWGALVAGAAPHAPGEAAIAWMPNGPPHLDRSAPPLAVEVGSVGWVHRGLGVVLAIAVTLLFARARRILTDPGLLSYNRTFFRLLWIQTALGVLAVLYAVPVGLGVAHQGLAMVMFGVWLAWLHAVGRPAT